MALQGCATNRVLFVMERLICDDVFRPASIDAVRFCNFSRKTRRAVFSCSLSSLEAAFASQRPETETDDKEEPKAEGEEEQKSGATKKEIVQEAEEQGMEVAAECKAEVTESVKQVECQGGEQAVAGDETGGEEGQVGNEEGGENAREAPRGDNKDKPQVYAVLVAMPPYILSCTPTPCLELLLREPQ